ncbi:MAG: translation elongation factor Ts [Solirubrobacterales bacterium]
MSVAASEVKTLRERTGAGMMECKKALEQAGGDVEKAIEILRVKGQAKAAKRGEREAGEGAIAHYVHTNGRVGALVEVDCETDFVARNDDFLEFARDVAIHVVGLGPKYASHEEVPEDVKQAELELFQQQADDSKSPEIQQKIAQGRLGKWLAEIVLLDQVHVNTDKYDGRTIEELRAEISARTGENVVIRRFARFQVGE